MIRALDADESIVDLGQCQRSPIQHELRLLAPTRDAQRKRERYRSLAADGQLNILSKGIIGFLVYLDWNALGPSLGPHGGWPVKRGSEPAVGVLHPHSNGKVRPEA